MVAASLVNSPLGGKVDTVATPATQRRPSRLLEPERARRAGCFRLLDLLASMPFLRLH
jgi:hypothetical protein